MGFTGDCLGLVMMGGLSEVFREGADIRMRFSQKVLSSKFLEPVSPRSCYEIDRNQDYLTQARKLVDSAGLQAREGYSLVWLFSEQSDLGSGKSLVTFYQVPSEVIEKEVKEFASAFMFSSL